MKLDNRKMGRVPFHVPPEHYRNFSYSQGQDARSTPEDIRSRFYEDYRKVADEYDKEFNKRYDEDLNTTLIFVSLESCSDVTYVLTWITGWSILRRHFRLHHSSRLPTPARPKRRNRRPPPRPHLQDRQYYFRRRRSYTPAVVWPPKYDRPGSSHPVCQSRSFAPLRFPRDARQAMVEPIRINRYARNRRRAQPESTTETQWHRQLVFRVCNGVAAADVASCAIAARLCSVPIPLGHRHYDRVSRPRCHFIRRRLLPFHRRNRDNI